MRVICAWCKKKMENKEPLEDNRISHSCCEKCFDYVLKDFEKEEEDLCTQKHGK